MARIVGGIGASHSPTIGFAKDTDKAADPAWTPIFAGFEEIKTWMKEKDIDVLFLIYNDHVSSFFFDHYSAFALGVDGSYRPADEGGGPRDVPSAKGHAALARHIAQALVADEFDMAFFQKKPLDHGCFSPLSMIAGGEDGWAGSIVPLQVGVLQFPIPSARRCYRLGRSLRKAVESFPEDDLKVAVMATGGLSHQVHGERCGFNNEAWDECFLDLLESDPGCLTEMRLAEYAELGGLEGAEVIMWLIMRGALSDKVKRVHRATYLPSMTNIATVVYEDLGAAPAPLEIEAYRTHMTRELAGVEKLPGTYPFTLERSHKAFRVNDFLHRLTIPEHRAHFLDDPEALFEDFGLSAEERDLIRGRKWIEMIRYGVSFFVIEKMAAVLGHSNPEIYAGFRGEDLETFQRSRKVAMQYSVAGGDRARDLDKR